MVLCCSCDGVPLKLKNKTGGHPVYQHGLRIRWTIPLKGKFVADVPCESSRHLLTSMHQQFLAGLVEGHYCHHKRTVAADVYFKFFSVAKSFSRPLPQSRVGTKLRFVN